MDLIWFTIMSKICTLYGGCGKHNLGEGYFQFSSACATRVTATLFHLIIISHCHFVHPMCIWIVFYWLLILYWTRKLQVSVLIQGLLNLVTHLNDRWNWTCSLFSRKLDSGTDLLSPFISIPAHRDVVKSISVCQNVPDYFSSVSHDRWVAHFAMIHVFPGL